MKVSVIIPVRTITPYVRETVSYLKKQTECNFEIIVITDKSEKLSGAKVFASGNPTPAYKRNFGVDKSKGSVLAFLDDDSYPEKEWLANALKIFRESDSICAVCGPALTPPSDNLWSKASGEVWASWFGSGGAGVYRNRSMGRREVDDFPSVNLIVKKSDFLKVGGFDVEHWPGEDTKLCLDLVNRGKRIIYDPSVLVYHHRRPVLLPHLKQIGRYARRRGYFARVFPKTSFKAGYILPSLFAYGLIFGGIVSFLNPLFKNVYLTALIIYGIFLLLAGVEIGIRNKSLLLPAVSVISIFATHLWYGFLFPAGFFNKKIKTIPHKLDEKKKVYVGG